MNINQLLFLTFLLFFYIHYSTTEIYENFEEPEEITQSSCIQRMLDYECIDMEKREKNEVSILKNIFKTTYL